jgi:acyl dehydratase
MLESGVRPKVLHVEQDRLVNFAEATNDGNPAARTGQVAPPLFAVVPMYRPMGRAIAAVTPEERIMYTLHAEQDMRFYAPIKPGMDLRAEAAPVGIEAKSSGTLVTIFGTVNDQSGERLCDQWISVFIRGSGDTVSAGKSMPQRPVLDAQRSDVPSSSVRQKVDADQTFRFAKASGDPMAVHLDDEVARQYGLPGIICHGLCTMAFAGNAAVANLASGNPDRMRRLAVRFAKPLLPDQVITTRFWLASVGDGVRTYVFDTVDESGERVLTNGLVEVAELESALEKL